MGQVAGGSAALVLLSFVRVRYGDFQVVVLFLLFNGKEASNGAEQSRAAKSKSKSLL